MSSDYPSGVNSGDRRKLTVLFFVCALLLYTSYYLPRTDARAQTRFQELQGSIASHNEEIKKLESEIAEYQNKLNEVGGQKKTLTNAVKELDLTRAKLGKDITLTGKRIDQTKYEIYQLDLGITDKERKIKNNKRLIADIIHKIDQGDTQSLVEMLLRNSSLSDFFSDIEDLERLQSSIQDGIRSLERLRGELSASRVVQVGEQRKLTALNDRLSDQKMIADSARKSQNTLLIQTKNQESNYKKQLSDKEAKKRQFEREVSDFEAQLRAEIDPNSFPRPGTKVLAYPIDSVTITQKFGKTSDSGRLYSSGTHNGIDLRAAVGTAINAAGDGIVVATGDTDKNCAGASYGRWILLQHKNGLSTIYGHLSLIKVTDGQAVRMGELIGYSGSTGYATGPHLHFGLFVTTAVEVANIPSKTCSKAVFRIPVSPANGYLDPEDYL